MRLHILKLFLIALALSGCDKFNQSKKNELPPPPQAISTINVNKSFDIECQNQADIWYKSNIENMYKDLKEMDTMGWQFYMSKKITQCKLSRIDNIETYSCYGTNGKVDITNEEALLINKINNYINIRTKEIEAEKKELKEIYLAKSKFCTDK